MGVRLDLQGSEAVAKAVQAALPSFPVHTQTQNVEIDEVWLDDDGQDSSEPLMYATLYSTRLTAHFNYLDLA